MEYNSLPDINGLATLKAVVELGGVTEAARVLHVGQPAVTKRLRGLDLCYGTPLMRRIGHRLELTEAGKMVYTYACLVLDHQSALQDDLQQLTSGQNKLRLGVTLAIGEHFLPDLLLRFAERYPQHTIESRVGYSRRIQQRLATGFYDLALLEQAPDHPRILVQKWLDDELMLVCGAGHPLWGCEMIAVTELVGLKYVLREPEAATRITLDQALKDIELGPLPIVMEVGSTDTIVEILQSGRYVSFLPRFVVDDAPLVGGLHHIKIQGLRINRTLWIALNRDNLNNTVADAFIQLLWNK
ncbi:MAG: LysR family transcriptional regulator [Candidatus Thiodiazotropha sp.]|jgi:DNA-binding transcriptional LysR family regulator